MKLIGKEYKVKMATDYSKFSKLPMNRDIDSKHVQKMVFSLRKQGCIRAVICCRTNIIEGIEKLYIIDGQHLATALEREGQPIPYVEYTVESEEDLISKMSYLNNSSKSWDLTNYINAWKMIKPDYMKLFKWKNLYDLEPTMIAAIAQNMVSIRYSTRPIKDGSFVITNPDAEKMCKDFNNIFLKIGMVDRGVKFQFLSAFLLAYGKTPQAAILINIDKHLATVKLMANGNETGQFIKKEIFDLK
jgi:hypothetical protein